MLVELSVVAGVAVTQVAARYAVSRHSVHSWVRKYEQSGLAGAGASSASVSVAQPPLCSRTGSPSTSRPHGSKSSPRGASLCRQPDRTRKPQRRSTLCAPGHGSHYGRLRRGSAGGGRHPRPRCGCGIRRRQGRGAHRALATSAGALAHHHEVVRTPRNTMSAPLRSSIEGPRRQKILDIYLDHLAGATARAWLVHRTHGPGARRCALRTGIAALETDILMTGEPWCG
jgi:transposase-like protein